VSTNSADGTAAINKNCEIYFTGLQAARLYVFLPKENYPMRISVQADEGDQVSISADFISVEQAIVTLEIENTFYDSHTELESVALSIDKARELAAALLSVVNAIEFVKAPTNVIRFDRELRRISGIKR
jgi:hypothetical protein